MGEKWIREAKIVSSAPAAILGSDAQNSSQPILEYLDNANLFLLPQDDRRRWYRYHHLFAQFLQGRLQQASSIDVPELHRRAANWFEENGHTSEAISHAIQAHDYDRAVEIIDEYADYFLMSSQITILLGWLRSLPEELLCSRASLRFTYAWTLLLSGYPLEVVQKYLLEDEHCEEDHMAGRALVLRAFIASMQGDTQRAAELSRIVARDLSEDDSFLQSINAWNIGISKIWGGDIPAGLKALQKAERIAGESGNLMVAVVSLSHQAEIRMILGELNEAETLFGRALDLAVDHHGNPIPIAGMAWVGMGDLQREYNQLESARKSLEKGIALAQKWGQIGALDGYISLARLKQSLGDWKGAQKEFDSANQIAEKFDTTELDDVLVAAYQARLWVARADYQRVQEWVDARGLNKEGLGEIQVHLDRGDFSNNYLETLDYITLVRLMIAREQFEPARTFLEKLIPVLERKGLHGLAFECQALMAVILHSLGEEALAIQELENVLRLAGPQGYARLFLDLGAPMAGLLYQFIRRRTEDTPQRRCAQKLLRAFEVGQRGQELGEKADSLVEPLSDREFEVLQLVAEGLSNQQIGERLVVALSTVKTHLNNIYKKLGVSKRTQAVARARELELL
jgi:LuxR family maltose regulon positive regulatory protein